MWSGIGKIDSPDSREIYKEHVNTVRLGSTSIVKEIKLVLPLGAIQIIRDTFLTILDPPLPPVSFGDTGADPPPPRVA
jgi:hypothetical protein